MKRKLFILILILISIFLTTFSLSLINKSITTKAIENYKYSWTKAICNETHCQDYEIHCQGNQLIKISPITGAIIQKPENWIDSRTEEWKNKIC